MPGRVVIIGAGQAGLQTAIALRQAGFEDEVVLLGREAHFPYQRPPLSKQVLKGDWPAAKCQLRKPEFLQAHGIDFRPSTEVTGLDPSARRIRLGDGAELAYGELVLCTGSRLNRIHLEGSALDGVHYLRTLDHALALKARLSGGTRLVVAGGGYIGLEVAATARQLGCEVTVIEAQDHVMKRAALPPLADFLLERHLAMGVDVRLGRTMTEIHGPERVRAVSLDDGALVDADVVVKGIGVRPELGLLEGCGLDLGRGVRVDSRCRTNIAGIHAAGDCCETLHPLYPGQQVLESVQNAVSQGKIVAADLLGEAACYEEVPWFWSEQFDCRYQVAGLSQPGDELVIRKSDPTSISVLSLGPDRLNAVQGINAPRDHMAARKLIALRERVDLARLKDPDSNLKELL